MTHQYRGTKMKKTLLALALMTALGSAFAGAPNWIAVGRSAAGPGAQYLDTASIKQPTSGYVAFWRKTVHPSADGSGEIVAVWEHVIAQCGGDFLTGTSSVAYGADGRVIETSAEATQWPLPPGSVNEATVNLACQYAARRAAVTQ
jgi:hypothetical protein